jgi:uncharacterized membrane protein (DUF4010 family)
MDDQFYRFVLALGIGILIGVQRESAYDETEGKLFAGARTFALMSLAGYVLAAVGDVSGSALPFTGGLVVLGVLLALAYHTDLVVGKPGMTTEMSVIVTYGTGGLCYWGSLPLAAALGVALMAMLSMKHEFRTFTHSITRQDIYAIVKFAVISVIVLPLLPNDTYGPEPLNVLNPYNIWLMVVFISGISFLGYVLIKIVGARRGIGLTGFLGGIASSTAVTISLARRSKISEQLSSPFALAILVAWVVMFIRILLVVAALAPSLAQRLLVPMGSAAVIGLLYCGFLYFIQWSTEPDTGEFSNPFELGPALRFGAMYAVVLVISRAAQVNFGDVGVYLSSVVSGIADVNAITLSVVDLSQRGNGLALDVAARAIVVAAMTNTLVKGLFAVASGSSGLRRALLPGMVLLLGTGVLTALLL